MFGHATHAAGSGDHGDDAARKLLAGASISVQTNALNERSRSCETSGKMVKKK